MDNGENGTDTTTRGDGDGDGAAASQARWRAWARVSAEWAGALGKLRAAEALVESRRRDADAVVAEMVRVEMPHSEITRVTGLDRKAIDALAALPSSARNDATAGSVRGRRPPALDTVTTVGGRPGSQAAGGVAAVS
jgi:hypothetical protein